MLKRETQSPITETLANGKKSVTHPAFGQIRAGRVSGNASLYDSEFNHQHYIQLSISRSRVERDLSTNWQFAGEELIEVSLSEAQWATFISSMNVGSGTSCTIEHVERQYMPYLPAPEASNKQFKQELELTLENIRADLLRAAGEIDGPLNKGKATALKNEMERISARLINSTGFVAKQFDEHIERTVEKAKIEINTHTFNLAQRTGIESLTNSEAAINYLQSEIPT